jgi:hypothetical protein
MPCSEILPDILCKPRLHMLLANSRCSTLPSMEALDNIKHLHMDMFDQVEGLLEMMPQLESVVIYEPFGDPKFDLGKIMIPWATLWEFGVNEAKEWPCILINSW